MWGVVALVVLTAAAGIAAWAALRPDTRDTGTVERAIVDSLKKQGLTQGPVSIDCPSSVEWRVGETFNCLASDDTGSATITVTMKNDEGAYTWVAHRT